MSINKFQLICCYNKTPVQLKGTGVECIKVGIVAFVCVVLGEKIVGIAVNSFVYKLS